VSAGAPPRPPRSSDPIDRDELEALVEALIEEARQRARRRRRRYGACALLAAAIGIGAYLGIVRATSDGGSAAGAPLRRDTSADRFRVRNGPLTLFYPSSNTTAAPPTPFARIETIGQGTPKVIWHCPGDVWCGQSVSFDWAPDGRRLAFSLDEIGGTSGYAVGLHVVNVVTGKDIQIPGGAPSDTRDAGFPRYGRKVLNRIGCWPASQLDWSPDGRRLAYPCHVPHPPPGRPRNFIGILEINGSGHKAIPIPTAVAWPSWSADGTRIAYATGRTPNDHPSMFVVSLDGTQRQLLARDATAPAWSPDRRTIAYQARCGIRLVTPVGRDVTPEGAPGCGAIGSSAPPVWSPDGKKIAFETSEGTYVMYATGRNLRRVSGKATTTWYGGLPGRPSWRPVH
jgi:hypothetical protein